VAGRPLEFYSCPTGLDAKAQLVSSGATGGAMAGALYTLTKLTAFGDDPNFAAVA
jgi:hypothetical protein